MRELGLVDMEIMQFGCEVDDFPGFVRRRLQRAEGQADDLRRVKLRHVVESAGNGVSVLIDLFVADAKDRVAVSIRPRSVRGVRHIGIGEIDAAMIACRQRLACVGGGGLSFRGKRPAEAARRKDRVRGLRIDMQGLRRIGDRPGANCTGARFTGGQGSPPGPVKMPLVSSVALAPGGGATRLPEASRYATATSTRVPGIITISETQIGFKA